MLAEEEEEEEKGEEGRRWRVNDESQELPAKTKTQKKVARN